MSDRSLPDRLWSLRLLARVGLTLCAVAAAVMLVGALWRAYVVAPWTRDGRVSAQSVRIAPEVSGTVLEVPVTDDQYVKRGEVLYRIDPARFELALAQAEARLAAADASLRQKTEDARRRRGMENLVPAEDIQRAIQAVAIAEAEQRGARVAVDMARLDVARTVLRAPVDGYVTRLKLNQGDYAVAGQPNIALVDAHSFWIIGYFEETKLRGIRPGAAARIRLMGSDDIIAGRVVSIGRGIADANQQADAQGLPSVAPTFSWVRLAQRIPVRVAFEQLPPDLVLAAGMTASVEVATGEATRLPRAASCRCCTTGCEGRRCSKNRIVRDPACAARPDGLAGDGGVRLHDRGSRLSLARRRGARQVGRGRGRPEPARSRGAARLVARVRRSDARPPGRSGAGPEPGSRYRAGAPAAGARRTHPDRLSVLADARGGRVGRGPARQQGPRSAARR